MAFWRKPSSEKPSNTVSAVTEEVHVPRDRSALVIRHGVPERFLTPGSHLVTLEDPKVEVRQLLVDPESLHELAPPDSRALALPFERSWLYLDGALAGVLVQPPDRHSAEAVPTIEAWEGYTPRHERRRQRRIVEPPAICLIEPLRSCLPASGICCGGRLAHATR